MGSNFTDMPIWTAALRTSSSRPSTPHIPVCNGLCADKERQLTHTSSYKRQETAFFHDTTIKRAIVDLAAADEITIYCGAGVTIDRTDLGWGDLIYGLLSRLPAGVIKPEEARALRDRLSPLELASIFQQYAENALASTPNAQPVDSHVPRLQEMLYTKAGWESGALVRNVVRLAVSLTILGKTVRVVTSNYDVYLEEEFDAYAKELKGEQSPEVPGFFSRCAGSPRQHRLHQSVGAVGQVEIVYLHGRIPRTGKRFGELALSEGDYHRIRDTVVQELESAFKNSSVLVVGASLSDPPLLYSLWKTAAKRQTKQKKQRKQLAALQTDPVRIALVPTTSTNLVGVDSAEFPRLADHLRQRAIQYGVRLLIPDFHYQVAQFCQEVITCASMGARANEYADQSASVPERYGSRLISWWDAWNTLAISKEPDSIRVQLLDCLSELVQVENWGTDVKEVYKIELWVRHDPSHQRTLALWGSSTGTLVDRRSLKCEELGIDTINVSVRAFIEGRPVWLAKEDLKNDDIRPQKKDWIKSIQGRWDRYLAVPIRLENSEKVSLPVGVITLTAKDAASQTNIPVQYVDSMKAMIECLTNVGRDLLNVY
jgi:SIR2-like domain